MDGSTTVTCTPNSGSTFLVGVTPVSCSSTDAHGNTGNGSFTVTVEDTTDPALTLPANITAEATGPLTTVDFTATASDLVDGSIAPSCDHPSGSTFALGTTTVNCSATDAHTNTSSGLFTITVQDTTAPVLTLPADISTVATGLTGAVVNFTTIATDLVDGTHPVVCDPASGSTFPIGTTTVNCLTSDTHENLNAGSFTVTVLPRSTTTLPTQPTTIIPITGSELVYLSCDRFSTLQTSNGYQVEFLAVLCGYQASLTVEQPSVLPAPIDGTFAGAITVNLVIGGTTQNILPAEAGMRITIPMPAGSSTADYKVMFWNTALNSGAGDWDELPVTLGNLSAEDSQHQVISGLTIVNGEAQFTVNFVGTFVIVGK